jgi:tripartite-type tricarboxylate transporter receptor subunit TctC
MTVLFGAGSAADVAARHLADGMSKILGAPVPVVNRTGAGGAVGYTHVYQQKPDGYAIVWSSNGILTNYHSAILPFNYDALDNVARVSVETPVLAVKADSPWKTLKELIEYAKANPGKVRVGNSGTGSHTHLAAAAIFSAGGANIINVPFGAGQATVNLLGGRIEAAVQLPAAFVAHVKSGAVRVLASLGSSREPLFADVPTAKELGYPVALDLWRGVAAPKGTPKPVVAKLEAAIKKTVESPEFKEAGKTIGFTPAYLPEDQFVKMIAEDDKQIAKVMDELGMKKK